MSDRCQIPGIRRESRHSPSTRPSPRVRVRVRVRFRIRVRVRVGVGVSFRVRAGDRIRGGVTYAEAGERARRDETGGVAGRDARGKAERVCDEQRASWLGLGLGRG